MYNPKHWKTTELYILKEWILQYMNYMSIKRYRKKKKIVLPNQALCRAPGS